MNKTSGKIIVSVIAIGLMVGCYLLLLNGKKAQEEGYIYVILIDSNQIEEKSEKLPFSKDQKLVDVIRLHYDITIVNGMLVKIDKIETPNTTQYFIKILINGVPATRGIEAIPLTSEDVISFVYTKTTGGTI